MNPLRGLDAHLTHTLDDPEDALYEVGSEALGDALRAFDKAPSVSPQVAAERMYALLVEFAGYATAAQVMRDFLEGDSDALNAGMVAWARENSNG